MERISTPLLCVLGVLYVLSPLDVVPDIIPILGWLDDIGVLGYLGYRITSGGKQESRAGANQLGSH